VIDVCRAVTQDNELVEQFEDDKPSKKSSSGGDSGGGAAIERIVISRGKHPALYTVARKATWGGSWVDNEGQFKGISKPQSGLLLDEVTRWYKELGYSEEEAKDAALGRVNMKHSDFLQEDNGGGLNDEDDVYIPLEHRDPEAERDDVIARITALTKQAEQELTSSTPSSTSTITTSFNRGTTRISKSKPKPNEEEEGKKSSQGRGRRRRSLFKK